MNKIMRNVCAALVGVSLGLCIRAPLTGVNAYGRPNDNNQLFSDRQRRDMVLEDRHNIRDEYRRNDSRNYYKHFRHDRADWYRRMERFRDWQMRNYFLRYADPMAAAQAAAIQLGLDINNNNNINVIRQTPSQALVKITQSGSNDNVNITVQITDDGSWKVASASDGED